MTSGTAFFEPNIIYKGKEPVEFACFPLSQYQDYRAVSYPSIFPVLETYYAEKNIVTKMRQKTVDLRKIVQNALERNVKKYQLQDGFEQQFGVNYLWTISTDT